MRRNHGAVIALLLGLGVLGIFWAATAQERHTPWPPPPVRPPDHVSAMDAPEVVETPTISDAPAPAPSTVPADPVITPVQHVDGLPQIPEAPQLLPTPAPSAIAEPKMEAMPPAPMAVAPPPVANAGEPVRNQVPVAAPPPNVVSTQSKKDPFLPVPPPITPPPVTLPVEGPADVLPVAVPMPPTAPNPLPTTVSPSAKPLEATVPSPLPALLPVGSPPNKGDATPPIKSSVAQMPKSKPSDPPDIVIEPLPPPRPLPGSSTPSPLPAETTKPVPNPMPDIAPQVDPPKLKPMPNPMPDIAPHVDPPKPKPVTPPTTIIEEPRGLPDIIKTPNNPPKAKPIMPQTPAVEEPKGQPESGKLDPEPKVPPRPAAFRLVNPNRRANPNVSVPENAPPLPLHPLPSTLAPPPHGSLVTPTIAGGSAQVVLEKRCSGTVHLGQPLTYAIAVRNTGAFPVSSVRVEEEIPHGATVLTTDPPAQRLGDRLIWTVPMLAAGSETLLRIDVQPLRPGEWSAQTVAQATLATTSKGQVLGNVPRQASGAMALTVHSPSSVRVNQVSPFSIQVTNTGGEKLTGLLLQVRLSAGLKHPMGQEIEANLPDLEPGAKKSFDVSTTAIAPGRHAIEVRITTKNGTEAVGQGSVSVSGDSVMIQQAPATRVLMNREGELRLNVTNHHAQPLKNVTVTDLLPEGVEFVRASDRGIYRQDSRTVYWLLEHLEPAQTQTLVVKVQGNKNGQFANEATVRAKDLPETRSSSQVLIEGHANLTMKIADRDDPLEVGKETVYEIRIANQGTGPATNLNLNLTLSEGLTPQHAQGPGSYQIHGQQVVFSTLTLLHGNDQAVFHLSARAVAAGDCRLRAQLTCDQSNSPLAKEERTWVYQAQ